MQRPVRTVSGRQCVVRAARTQRRQGRYCRCAAETPLARRDVLSASGLTAAALLLQPVAEARAQTDEARRRVFLEIAVDGKPLGEVVIELFDDVSIGSERFRDLAIGKQGVGYRRSRFDAIFPGEYIRCAGVASLSYSNEDSPIAGGDSTAALERELAASTRRHNSAGVVSIQVGLPEGALSATKKLVASQGKLIEVESRAGLIPNGTAFAITLGAAPELDGLYLVVGRVVSGDEVLQQVARLPVVKDNSNSPFFAAGKAIGDKRAVVAELGFNRPFNRVTVSRSGTRDLAATPASL